MKVNSETQRHCRSQKGEVQSGGRIKARRAVLCDVFSRKEEQASVLGSHWLNGKSNFPIMPALVTMCQTLNEMASNLPVMRP